MSPTTAFDLSTCARPNILKLLPYRCARDDYKNDGTNILLDANENAHGPGLALDPTGKLANASLGNGSTHNATLDCSPRVSSNEVDLKGLNRYPDPHQHDLKQLLCKLRQDSGHQPDSAPPLVSDNLFVGVGSDEAIDAAIRCFCIPGKDKILICPPTYGMYTVSANINDAGVVKVPQNVDEDGRFALDMEGIEQTIDEDLAVFKRDPSQGRIKLVFVCTPGNPTGQVIEKHDVERLLAHPNFNGLIVLDEAYVDFAPRSTSLASLVTSYPNLAVMQTLSKAFGLAGIRLGACFTSPEIAQVMNNVKAPYNISSITSQLACQALQQENLAVMEKHKKSILGQRDLLVQELPRIPGIGRLRGGFDANFLLTEILGRPSGKPDNPTAMRVYETLASQKGVVTRFRGKEHGCEGCLRITVGTKEEVGRFLGELRSTLEDIYMSQAAAAMNGLNEGKEHRKEEEESAVIA